MSQCLSIPRRSKKLLGYSRRPTDSIGDCFLRSINYKMEFITVHLPGVEDPTITLIYEPEQPLRLMLDSLTNDYGLSK